VPQGFLLDVGTDHRFRGEGRMRRVDSLSETSP
jgi:hypothetical protein